MQTFRVSLGTFAVLVALLAGACRTTGDWKHPPNSPQGEDQKQYSVQESLEFYRNFFPARAYYVFIAVPEGTDKSSGLSSYSFIIFRVFDQRDGREVKRPFVERIIGPVRSADEWTDLFSIFRRYSSSPPAGYYCWQNDCVGKYNPPGDPDPRDPYPPNLPGVPPAYSAVGYSVVPVGGADGGVKVVEQDIERARQLALVNGTGGSQGFEPREGTVITAEYIEQLRTFVEGIQTAFRNPPAAPPPRSSK
jgi:hypothetical protein